MTLVGLISPIVGAIVYAGILRRLPASLRLVSVVLLGLLVFVVLSIALAAAGRPLPAIEWFVALLMTVSLGYAEILMFILVLYDSPTMALVTAIGDHEPTGMPVEDLDSFIARHPFIESRLDAMVDGGIIAESDGVLRIRRGAGFLMKLSGMYRLLSGRTSERG